ncbi:hypothetical protein [Alkalihalobacillus sp. AL-G]|uniref:hypothetical protein n=1 Tax=Alkalihalobacillus sp. AL-G TaxID=2926399 RepID=UPI00272A3121|nr:hypothetical protein [Alkalihalobacillus sp. AL-G]WLD94707.1 hypothetical protein MOJ78_07440 [Alkalihalobacillus sp. AL-G]
MNVALIKMKKTDREVVVNEAINRYGVTDVEMDTYEETEERGDPIKGHPSFVL